MPKPTPKTLYTVTAKYNGEEKTIAGDDLNTMLLELRPEQLLTEMYLTITKGKNMTERRLSLLQGRMAFSDDMTREILINNLEFSLS